MDAFRAATITSDRLVLTPLRPADAEAMVTVLGDEQLHEFIGGHPTGPADLRRRYERLSAGSGDPGQIWLNWIVRRGTDRQPIGTVQATVTRAGEVRAAAVAWVIGVPWQAQGFARRSRAGHGRLATRAGRDGHHRPHPSRPSRVRARRRPSRPHRDPGGNRRS
jgi:RimJ/RimL family protein N-acetyltransferase